MTKPILMPQIEGEWWTIAGHPDLGAYNSKRQQPMDFGLWQAADDTWQLGACVRRTNCGGKGRLLYRWQADALTDRNWKAMGIMLEADSNYGETAGNTLFTNVNIFNGTENKLYKGMNVLVEGKTISSISANTITAPDGTTVIDGGGKTPSR